MVVEFFCPRWGSEHIAWDMFLQKVKAAGYKGVEWFPYSEQVDYDVVMQQIKAHGLKLCIVIAVTDPFLSFDVYLQKLKQDLQHLSRIGPPLFISAQTGREYYAAEQIEQCLACCDEVSRETGVPIYQETHRNKWSYAAHCVYPMLQKYPELMLTLDVSHWFCVSESYLEDQQEKMELAINHARHIHARVGHTQGSQVADPARPEYRQALQAHLKIWDAWVALQKSKGTESCTITTEFGPPPYLTNLNENMPDDEEQWRLNVWMKDLLDKRYNNQ